MTARKIRMSPQTAAVLAVLIEAADQAHYGLDRKSVV